MSVTEGFTFTDAIDGAGAYPGVAAEEQNQGFHSAIEIILALENTEELRSNFFQHPVHVAAAKVIDPLIEDAWAMDWLEDRVSLVVPSATASVMKHIVFFQFELGTTHEQTSALFTAWRGLPKSLSHVLAVSCDNSIGTDNRGYHACLVVDLQLSSCDGVQEISDYANSDAYQKINKELLAPIRKSYVVMDFAEHRGPGMGKGTLCKL